MITPLMPKPWDPKAAARRSEARQKEREKIKQAEKLMDMAAGRVEDRPSDDDAINVDLDRSASVWSTIRDEEVGGGKERGGSEGNPAAAGVGTMTEKQGTPEGDPRQGNVPEDDRDDSDQIVEPPPLNEGDKQPPPFKVLRAEQTAEYTLNRLNPKMREFAIIGYDALEKAVAEEPVTWAWEGVAADNSHVEISGPSNSGKTCLTFILAAASASTVGPVEVFGRKVIPVPRGKTVLLIEEEDGIPDCRDKLRAACEMLGLDPRPTINRIVILCRSGFHPGGELAEIVRADADRGCYGRIFLDSKARIFFESKANSEEDQASAARWITELINRARCSVWVVSHTRKGSATELDDMSGNHQRAAAADVVLLVTSKKAKLGRVLSSRIVFKKLRKMTRAKDHPKALVFTIGCDEKDRWQLTHKELSDDDLEAGPDQPLAEKIVSMLREDEDGVSVSKIRQQTRSGAKAVTAAINELVEQKVVLEFSKPSRGPGGKARYIKLRPSGHFDSFDELVDDAGDEDDEE